jgi:hypothetical protein
MRADTWAFVRPETIENQAWEGQLPPTEVLTRLQYDARAGIQRVRDGEWFELESGIGYGIARMGEQIVRGSRRGRFEDLFRAAVMDVVQTLWDRLHECPFCHAVFLRLGKRKYCSPACASRTHWEAFKARRKSRDHHREYTRRARKRTGSNVKVKARKRA